MYGGSRVGAAADPLRTRRFFLAGVAVGVLAMSATGFAAATLIASPGQVAARYAAPPAAVITGYARWQVLRHGIVLPAVVMAARTISVTASAPYARDIVTAVDVRVDDRVRPGQVLAQLDGRPVLLLRGVLPAYRDLREGDTGPDVTQLQAALERLGYADFDQPGVFGQSTSLALLLFYRHLGYRPPLVHRSRASARLPVPRAYLPMSEVTYIPAPSALVLSVSARTGTAVPSGAPVLRLAVGRPYVAGVLDQYQAAQARDGIAARVVSARVVSARLRRAASGTITRLGAIAASASGSGAAVTGYPVVVSTRRALPQALIGTAVRLTLWVAVTSQPVLTVPASAVFAAAGRQWPYVVTTGPHGRRSRIPVRTGPVADGVAAVQPVRPGTLRPGDRVLIGWGR